MSDPTPIKPTDHKQRKPKAFKFEVDGHTYKLPLVTEAQNHLDGGDLMDAALEGDIGQMTYTMKALKAVAPPETLEVLRSLPQPRMLDIVNEWGEFGDGDGASLGESPGSPS